MAEHLGPKTLLVELPGQTAQEHHREFQTLGLVDTHDGDGAGGALALHLQSLFLLQGQVLQELLQIPVAAVFVARRQLIERLEVRPAHLAVRHGGIDTVHPGQGEDLLDQVGNGVHPCLPPQHRQGVQKCPVLLIFLLGQGIIDRAFFIFAAEGRQLVGGEAENGACHGGDEGNILPGVGYDLQNGAEGLDLRGGQQVGAAAGGAANALGFQRLPELGTHTSGRAQQDHDVIGLHGAQLILFPNQGARVQHFFDPLRHICRFLGVGVALDIDTVELYGGVRQWLPGQTLVEGFVGAVVETAHPLAHAAFKNVIDRLDDLGTGAEIGAEEHLPPLPCRRVLHVGIAVVFFQEDAGICQTELVDGLLHIAHHEAVVGASGEGGEDGVLYLVGVLILVHHDLHEPLPQVGSGGGAYLVTKSILPPQQLQHQMLQIAEVHAAADPLGTAELTAEPAHQGDKPPPGGSGLGKIAQNLGGIVGEPGQPLLDALLAGIPAGFDPCLGIFIKILREGQPPVFDGTVGRHSVPGGTCPEAPQIHQGDLEVQDHLALFVIFLRDLQTPLHGGNMQIQIGEKFLHQIFSPDGLGGIGNFRHIRVAQAFIEPLLGIRVAHGAVIDFQHDVRHQPVIPPQALGIHKGAEVGILVGAGVGVIQQIGEHPLPDLGALIFVSHPEITAELQLPGVFPHHIAAEAVDGGDLRQEQPLDLPLEVPVVRILGNSFRQPGGDLAPQLGGSGLGVCNDEEIVQIDPCILQILHEPLHQHLGLAGARGGGHQQIAAPVQAGGFLLFGQWHAGSLLLSISSQNSSADTAARLRRPSTSVSWHTAPKGQKAQALWLLPRV